MARVLLLLCLALSPWPRPTLAQSCPANITVQDGETKQIKVEKGEAGSKEKFTMYLKPSEAFEGVSLKVAGPNDTEWRAWFPANSTCFPRDGQWYQVIVQARARDANLLFVLQIADCVQACQTMDPLPSVNNFTLVAHGQSEWRYEVVTECNTVFTDALPLPTTGHICKTPPDEPPPTDEPGTATGGPTWHAVLAILALIAATAL
ncbi:hypothetical protein GWK47_003484 [Chionoecetes opilio]|uniref:Secreted protein n=1 Tax=Chionoecetes opilio TaxID=41210 RepID=A0A8J4YRU0_CHIOP|nr:hypothetical protein GWK47_003484 [Chionoecetes opilio]